MLHVYYGNDVTRVRQKAFEFLQSVVEEDALVTKVTPESYGTGMLEELTAGTSLFGGTQVVLMDTLSEGGADIFAEIIEGLEAMEASVNRFIMIEAALAAAEKKKVEAKATKAIEVTGEKKEKFNAFLMTDALLRKDKKSLWLLLQEAWKQGLSNEEIIGVLFWQIKTLRLVEKTKSAEEAGQKPFVYQKAKRALGSFKEGELDRLSEGLLVAYHDGHMGRVDTGLALEKWVLSL
jgi:DNA polymerase III delta subunit